MNNKLLSILMLCLSIIGLTACSSSDEDEAQKRIEITKIIENRSTQDLLNDLYIGSDGNIQALCRILNTTPSVVERIRNGKTEATSKFDERIREVTVYYSINSQSFSKLRSVLDPEYAWYNSILDMPSNHPYIFWSITICAILWIVVWMLLDYFFWIIALIWGLLFFIAWISSLLFSPKNLEDNYVNTINPVMEQVI